MGLKQYNVVCAVKGRVHVTVKARSLAHARQLVADHEGIEFMPPDLERGEVLDVWLSHKG